MELISEDLHLTLAYVAAVGRAGAPLAVAELEAYSVSPRPTKAVVGQAGLATFASMVAAMTTVLAPAESRLEYLKRVRWIAIEEDYVTLTPLGKAVLEDANRPKLLDPADEPLSVTIDPSDPLAYVRVFELVASHGTGLLVDPYLDLNALGDVAEISSVDRVLTGDGSKGKRLGLLARGLAQMGGGVQVRIVPSASLHDRFFIPDDGPVYIFGSSLNSITKRPGVVTPIAGHAGATSIRTTYAAIWGQGTPLLAVGDSPPAE